MYKIEFKNPPLTGQDMTAKYSDAIILFLRTREKEMGPEPVHLKVISEHVMTMIGLTDEERARLTKGEGNQTARWSIYYCFQILKFMGLLKNSRRSYWKLTPKGRKSRYSHNHYLQAYKELLTLYKSKKVKFKRVNNHEN